MGDLGKVMVVDQIRKTTCKKVMVNHVTCVLSCRRLIRRYWGEHVRFSFVFLNLSNLVVGKFWEFKFACLKAGEVEKHFI